MIVRRPTTLAALAAITMSACAVSLREQVPPEEAALRLVQNRAGIMVGDELVRATFMPGELFVVASRREGGKAVLTFVGPSGRYRGGLLSGKERAGPALARARAASAFHVPVEADAPGTPVWVVHDVVPRVVGGQPEHALTLEAYPSDPRPAWSRGDLVRPERVWVFGRRDLEGKETHVDARSRAMFSWRGTLLRPVKLERRDGRLTALAFERWTPSTDAILSGQTAETLLAPEESGSTLAVERLLNDTLVEWKTRRLVEWARGANVEQLEDAIVKAEKGMLELDRRGRVLKDEIDTAARGGGGVQPALTERAQLLDQRRTLVGVVVTTLKQARAAARELPAAAPGR